MHRADSLYVVGIGASAGGLETLQEFFQHIPANTGFAFVIIQHLSMPIRVVEQKTALRPNHIYLISKDWDLEQHDGHLVPVEKLKEGRNAKMSIDRFLKSLARSREHAAIAIILSGTGTDGSLGIKEIKEQGGVVMAQDPQTAKFGGMPKSVIETGLADFVLSPEGLGKKLIQLARLIREGKNITEQGGDENEFLDKVLVLVKKATHIDFTYYRKPTLLRRIDKRCKLVNANSQQKYLEYLEKEQAEPSLLAQEFLIGVSSFFRDEHLWHILAQQVVPALFQNKPNGEPLRLWVAGCSTGEEAYTLAIQLLEYKKIFGSSQDFKIFATDLDPAAINIASRGLYGTDILQQVPSQLLDRYFEQDEKGYVVSKRLREHIVFTQHNLITNPPFIRMDLISCRNTLIYFTPATQQQLISKFHFSLNQKGFLFLGTSENLGDHAALFKLVERGPTFIKTLQTINKEILSATSPSIAPL